MVVTPDRFVLSGLRVSSLCSLFRRGLLASQERNHQAGEKSLFIADVSQPVADFSAHLTIGVGRPAFSINPRLDRREELLQVFRSL